MSGQSNPRPPGKTTPIASLLSRFHTSSTTSDLLATKLLRPLPLLPTPQSSQPPPSDARSVRRARRQALAAKHARRHPQPLSASERRATRAHNYDRRSVTYDTFLPVHELWLSYARQLLGMGGGPAAMAQRLAAGDLHGAVLEVVRARCVDRVGIRGIVVKETRNAVEIVQKPEDLAGKKRRGKRGAVRVVPKEHSVFRLSVPVEGEEGKGEQETGSKRREMVFELYGSQLQFRAAERAGRKFKSKVMDV